MKKLRLILWNAAEAEGRAKDLQELGYQVDFEPPQDYRFMQPLRSQPPDAILIDLNRAPSRGRGVALMVRQSPQTRPVPIVFLGGEEAKLAQIREQIPDAHYGTWEQVASLLGSIWSGALPTSSREHSIFEVYEARSLIQKLGIRANFKVSLIDAPPGFPGTLGTLPPGATLMTGFKRSADLILLFVTDSAELEGWFETLAEATLAVPLWICWPKQSSGRRSPLKGPGIHSSARRWGFSEYKVCSIDNVWTAKLFTRRQG